MRPKFEYEHYSQPFYHPPSGGVDRGCGLGWRLRGWGAWGQVPVPGYLVLCRTDWTRASVSVCDLAGNTAYVM
eukprot:782380-Rhodomonas_salina.1